MSVSASVSLVVGFDITGVELWTKTDERIRKCSRGTIPLGLNQEPKLWLVPSVG